MQCSHPSRWQLLHRSDYFSRGLSESFTGPHEENGMGAFCSRQARQASGRGGFSNDTQLYRGCRCPWDVIIGGTLYISLLMPGG